MKTVFPCSFIQRAMNCSAAIEDKLNDIGVFISCAGYSAFEAGTKFIHPPIILLPTYTPSLQHAHFILKVPW